VKLVLLPKSGVKCSRANTLDLDHPKRRLAVANLDYFQIGCPANVAGAEEH
jgi:hypothetical protein